MIPSRDTPPIHPAARARNRKCGAKFDAGKEAWELLPIGPVRQVVRVLTYGAGIYTADNWQRVPRARDRYYAAALRHLTAWREGELVDPESKLPHLAHMACCALFLIWFDTQRRGAK
jgi:hypothetical protein